MSADGKPAAPLNDSSLVGVGDDRPLQRSPTNTSPDVLLNLVTRNPAPDASPPMMPSPGGVVVVGAGVALGTICGTAVAHGTVPAFAAHADAFRAAAGPVDQEQIRRAFEIADAAMFVALQSYGVPRGDDGTAFGLTGSDSVVATVAEACDELREAIEWLVQRNYVEIARDEQQGEYAVVIRQPGEEQF